MRDLVTLDDLPEAIFARMIGRALVHHDARAVRERAVDDVAVAGDPADVGGAPVDVVVVQIEDEPGAPHASAADIRPRCAARPSAFRSCRSCRGCREDARNRTARRGNLSTRLFRDRATRDRGRPAMRHFRRCAERRSISRWSGNSSSAASAVSFSGTTLPRR